MANELNTIFVLSTGFSSRFHTHTYIASQHIFSQVVDEYRGKCTLETHVSWCFETLISTSNIPGLVYWSIGAVFEAIRQGHVVSLLQDLNLYKVYCRQTHAQKIVNVLFSDSTVWVDFWVNIMFIWYHPAHTHTHRWCCAVSCVVSPYSVSILKWKFHGGPTMLTQGATWLRRKLGVITTYLLGWSSK